MELKHLSKHHENTTVQKHLYLRNQDISAVHAVPQKAAVTHKVQEKLSSIINPILYNLLVF